MSLFYFSCSRQEIEAALAYFSANSSSLSSTVYQFYQTLQTQIAADETSQTTLPETESTRLRRLLLSQQHPLLTPSPSPLRASGPQPLKEFEEFQGHPLPLSPRSLAPGMQELKMTELGDAEPPNAQSISTFSHDFGEVLSSSNESPGGEGGEVGDSGRVGSSTNDQSDHNQSKRKRNRGPERENEEGGGGGTGSRGAKKNRGGKKNNGRGKKSGGGGHSGCSRNGTNVQRKTRAQLAASAGAEEGLGEGVGDTPGEGMEGSGDSSGEGLNPSDASFVYSPYRASPSQAVREECSLLLLNLSSSPNSLDWVEEFSRDLEGEPWAEADALTTESLKNLALRCSRSQKLNLLGTFCKMLNELMFTAKVNSIFHAQKMVYPAKMPSLEGILNTLQQEGFGGNDLGKWLSLGSRWARVAGAVLAEVCHEIRAPSPENLAL
ncbi:hypothetical protein F5878DRAFT_647485, partial [Lentinula raphanica]